MQVIEFARNVLGMTEANSTEFAAATPHPVVVFMPEISTTHKVRALVVVQGEGGYAHDESGTVWSVRVNGLHAPVGRPCM